MKLNIDDKTRNSFLETFFENNRIVVREITGLGLSEAKALVDNAPSVLKENVPTAEAKEMETKLKEAGATVELK